MKNLFSSFSTLLYLLIILLIELAFFLSESNAQKWITHTGPQIPGKTVRDLLVDKQGNIWCATENGVARFNGEWITFREENGLVHNNVWCMESDIEGNIWFGTDAGLNKICPTNDLYNSKNWISYTRDNTEGGLISNQIKKIFVDRVNNIWVGTASSGICFINLFPNPCSAYRGQDPLRDGKKWKSITEKNGLNSNKIIDIESGSDTLIWIATNNGLNVYNLKSDTLLSYSLYNYEAEHNHCDIFEGKGGNIWIGTAFTGIFAIFPDSSKSPDKFPNNQYTIKTTNSGLSSDFVWTVFQDNEGALWFGHDAGGGLSVLKSQKDIYDSSNWINYNIIDGLGDYNVLSIVEDSEQNIWFAHELEKGISQMDRTWCTYAIDKELLKNLINDILVDDQYFLWVGSDAGVIRFDLKYHSHFLEKQKKIFTTTDGLIGNKVSAIFQGSGGLIWIGTSVGVSCIRINPIDDMPTEWTNIDCDKGLIWNKVNCITEDKEQYLWIGTNQGISRVKANIDSILNENRWIDITDSNGLASNWIRDILCDMSGNLWIGTDRGLSYIRYGLDPKDTTNWINVDIIHGLIDNGVLSIYQDNQGFIWIATERGLSRIDSSSNLKIAKNWINFSAKDGLINDYVLSIDQLKEEEIWFGTANGASKLDISYSPFKWTNFTTSSGLAFARIKSLAHDDRNGDIWFGTRGGGLTRYRKKPLSPRTVLNSRYDVVTENNLTYSVDGFDLVTPQENIYFKYCIDDTMNWQTTFNKSITVFIEESEQPQLHTFYVKAVDSDGNIDKFGVQDFFYKLNPRLGGNIELPSTDFIVENTEMKDYEISLLIPSKVLNIGNSIEIISKEKYNLVDSSKVILAFEIKSQSSDWKFERPVTLRVTLPNSSNYNQIVLRIFRFNYKDMVWELVGGTKSNKADT